MSAITFRLPESKHERLKELAKAEHISLNRLFDELTTVALVQFDAKTNFKLRADKGNTERGIEILNKLSNKDV